MKNLKKTAESYFDLATFMKDGPGKTKVIATWENYVAEIYTPLTIPSSVRFILFVIIFHYILL